MISVLVPTLNAEATLPNTLAALVKGVIGEIVKEVIISDGGSADQTAAMAEAVGCDVIVGPRGRGPQLIAAAAAARAPWLLFLHADTVLEDGWVEEARRFMARSGSEDRAAVFTFAFDDDSLAARHVTFWVGLRCRILKLPYGDQGLLISRALYDALGGFKPIPLMEDVDLVRRIGGHRLTVLSTRAVTSAARFRREGFFRRSISNLILVTRFLMGADPRALARTYDAKA